MMNQLNVQKPAKKSRGDILHEQMVRLGEIQPEKPPLNKMRFLIISLVVLAMLAALFIVCDYRFGVIEEYELTLEASGEIQEPAVIIEETAPEAEAGAETAAAEEESGAPKDAAFGGFYKLGKIIAIVAGIIYTAFAVIKLLAPKRRKPNRSIWGDIGIYIMLFIVAIAMVFPLVFSVGASLKPLDVLFRFPPTVFPRQPTFDNFSDLFVTMSQSFVPFSRYLVNTVLITLIGTGGHVLIASMAAFVLSKYDFPGGKIFFSIVVTALMFSGYVTGIPNYVIMSKLNMIDTYWAIILPAFAAPIGLFLMKQFMEGLPMSLIEAAHLDGAGEFRVFWSIIMPNVKPAWLTIIIFSVQSLWNTNASTVIYSEAKKTLVYALQQIQAGGIARTGQAAAVTVIVMLVPITIFILSQSRILETMASSGLKD